ncbi:MAG TPA: YfiR family protein [Candidatus Saccharimonadales bacterium]|nr:YfiR family protein [Candidatus Saccharimonadales bacterium]
MAILRSLAGRSRIFASWLLALSTLVATAQSTETTAEYKVKAVYLIKFVQFVGWPASAFASGDAPLVIGVLGNDPFGRVLDEVPEGEVVKNRRVVIRRYRNIRDVDNAQVLFIGQSEAPRIRPILGELKGQSILTVSDIEGFSYEGGIVRFLMVNNKVRFRINVDAARDANLQISSKLLQLAEIVHDPVH